MVRNQGTPFVLASVLDMVAVVVLSLLTCPGISPGQDDSVTLANTDDWSEQLQQMVNDPDISEIHFLPFADYDSAENVVIRRGNLRIYGHGAKVSRRAFLGTVDNGGSPLTTGLKDMWTLRTEHMPIRNILIDGFVFDFVWWDRDFASMIRLSEGQFEDITIQNCLFMDSSNRGVQPGGQDCWMVNISPKPNEESAARVENFYFLGNVCIAKGIGMTSGGSIAKLENCNFINNTAIRGEISLGFSCNRDGGSTYNEIRFIGNHIINPNELGIHAGIDSNFSLNSSQDRILNINHFRMSNNVIRYGKRNSNETIHAAILRLGTYGDKDDILIDNNLIYVDPTLDNLLFDVYHNGIKPVVIEGVSEFGPHTIDAKNDFFGGFGDYRLNLRIGQHPDVGTIPVPPTRLRIIDNQGDISGGVPTTGTTRLRLVNLNEGNQHEEEIPDCTVPDFTSIEFADTNPIDEISREPLPNYHIDEDRKVPVISKPVEFDAGHFLLTFSFYSNSVCDTQNIFYGRNNGTYLRLEGSNSGDGLAGPMILNDAINGRIELVPGGIIKEHQSYTVAIGSIDETIRVFLNGELVQSSSIASAPITIQTIGTRLDILAPNQLDRENSFDGYIWNIGLPDSTGTDVMYDAVSDDSGDHWSDRNGSSNRCVLMRRDAFEFKGDVAGKLQQVFSVPYSNMDIKFKFYPKSLSNRYIFYGDTNHYLRIEDTGKIKMKVGPGPLIQLTSTDSIRADGAYQIHLRGFESPEGTRVQATLNGLPGAARIIPDSESVWFIESIGGNLSGGPAGRYLGFIWDICLGEHTDPRYEGVLNDAGTRLEDLNPNAVDNDAILMPFEN